jgi:hypothetical protein
MVLRQIPTKCRRGNARTVIPTKSGPSDLGKKTASFAVLRAGYRATGSRKISTVFVLSPPHSFISHFRFPSSCNNIWFEVIAIAYPFWWCERVICVCRNNIWRGGLGVHCIVRFTISFSYEVLPVDLLHLPSPCLQRSRTAPNSHFISHLYFLSRLPTQCGRVPTRLSVTVNDGRVTFRERLELDASVGDECW